MNHQPSTPYILNESTGVWSRPSYQSISYSDGDEAELSLHEIITHASDISILSAELKEHCTDWPKLYHLGSARANILRPFAKWINGKSVLEIGAGCGAITRGLGEWGANITALEGSMRRASIARARTRDLANVNVIAETFSAFESTQRYDMVTLIGVLEYASLFVDGPNADRTMINKARSLLKEDGILVIAIENQLGLKYFAGFPEDHKGIVGYGIENRYQNGDVRTYGRVTLGRLLESCNIKQQRFFAAYPDYKLPSVIISEEGLRNKNFDSASLIVATARQDPQMPAQLSFDTERTWPLLCGNQIALDLANSFLVIAGNSRITNLPSELEFAWHYNTGRRAEFTKATAFLQNEHGGIEIVRRKLREGDATTINQDELSNSIVPHEEYIHGTLLHAEFIQTLAQDGWRDIDVYNQFEKYFHVLRSILEKGNDYSIIDSHLIPGEYVDALPQNIIITQDGRCEPFDLEWRWNVPISGSYLVFRTLLTVMGSLNNLGKHNQVDFNNRLQVMVHILALLGIKDAEKAVSEHCKLEARLQTLSSGTRSTMPDLESLLAKWPCRPLNVWERNQSLQQQIQAADAYLHAAEGSKKKLNEEISRLTSEYNKLSQHLDAQARQITHLSSVVKDREQFIRVVTGSRSWLLTKPIRYVGRKFSLSRKQSAGLLIEGKSDFTLLKSHLMHRPTSLCVCIHAFHPELLDELSEKLSRIKVPFRALVTTTSENHEQVVEITDKWSCSSDVLILENRGRDILPFLLSLAKIRPNELILKLHTKKSSHRADGDAWRNDLLDKLLAPDMIKEAFATFRRDHKLGMVIPQGHILSVRDFIGHNQAKFVAICNQFIPGYASLYNPMFAGGSMFFVRSQAIMPVANICGNPNEYEPEQGQIDGTMAHAVERIFGVAVQAQNYRISSTANLLRPAQADANSLHTDPVLRK